MPSDLSRTLQEDDGSTGPASSRAVEFGLVWVYPPEIPRATRLNATRFVIGRDDSCDLPLQGALLSRRHARIRRAGSDVFIEDLDSTNGLFLNGSRVKQSELVCGDVIRIGEWIAIATELDTDFEPAYGALESGIFAGPELRRVLSRAELGARTELPVVLVGETGTGKERVARWLHEKSGRTGPLVAVNCATYTAATAPAELFGYRRGAFTGAERGHVGHVRAADGGTLLLDEIADLNQEVQAQLLRVIEQREVLPLGEARSFQVDVRFIAATQEPLARHVAGGRFRSDLRARLEAMVIDLPPLCDRRSEILPLFRHLLATHAPDVAAPALEPRAAERLCTYEWPLNVRELELLARRVLTHATLTQGVTLRTLTKLHPDLAPAGAGASSEDEVRPEPKPFLPEELERLQAALERHGGNLSRAARELSISRHRAYRLLKAAGRI